MFSISLVWKYYWSYTSTFEIQSLSKTNYRYKDLAVSCSSLLQLLLFSSFTRFLLINPNILYYCLSPTGNAFQEVPGSSVLQALSTLRTQQGFYSFPHGYLRAGFALLVRNIVAYLSML